MFTRLSNLTARKNGPCFSARTVTRHRRKIAFEPLEDRRLLAVTASWNGTLLTVTGDNADNNIVISVNGSFNVTVTNNGGGVAISGGAPFASTVEEIRVEGKDGNDTLNLSAVTSANQFSAAKLDVPGQVPDLPEDKDIDIDGGDGQDTIIGSQFADFIDGGMKDDIIEGRGGDDRIEGGSGNDDIQGDDGDDFIMGKSSGDTISGGNGDDLIEGDSGGDTIHGDAGNDEILGGSGNDTLYGDAGDDELKGNSGDDTLYGGVGNDRLEGNKDDAKCEIAVNVPCTPAQHDVIGNWTGGDTLDGGPGDDNYEFDFDDGQSQGMDRIDEGAYGGGVDALDFTDWGRFINIDLSLGSVQNVTWLSNNELFLYLAVPLDMENVYADADEDGDALNLDGTLGEFYAQPDGTETPNIIKGNSVANLLVGGPYEDWIEGGGGNDIIEGRDSRNLDSNGKINFDTLIGGPGNDVINGGAGDDLISGGGGNDRLNGDGYGEFVESGPMLLSPNGDQTPELKEPSGLIVSRTSPGILWTINDGDDEMARNELFANAADGTSRGYYSLRNNVGQPLNNTDWEDLGFYQDGAIKYLYVADIGDNDLARNNVTIYRFAEPTVTGTSDLFRGNITVTQSVNLSYPNGAHDAESFFVDPLTGDLYIVSKKEPFSGTTAQLYRRPKPTSWNGGSPLLLTDLGPVQFPAGTSNDSPSAADISPNGMEILVKSDNTIHHYVRTSTQTTIDVLLTGQSQPVQILAVPAQIPAVRDPNNRESVAFDPADGTTFFTVSEKGTTGAGQSVARPVHKYELAIGNDIVRGDGNDDILLGGGGIDLLEGGAGHDILDGGDEWDALIGGDGNDTMTGGAGFDYFAGGSGSNTATDMIEQGSLNATQLQAFPPDLDASSDTGKFSFDNITKDTTPTFSGKAPGSSLIIMYREPAGGGAKTQVGMKYTLGWGPYTITPTDPQPHGDWWYTVTIAQNGETTPSLHSPPLAVNIDTVAPKVSNVIVQSLTTSPGSTNLYSIPAQANSAAQLHAVHLTHGLDRIHVSYTENVDVPLGAVRVLDAPTSAVPTELGITVNTADPDQPNVTLNSTLFENRIWLAIEDAVTDIAGNAMDGEWERPSPLPSNPVNFADITNNSTFPSGNGSPGGDFHFKLTVWQGDTDNNGVIDIQDLNNVRNNFGGTGLGDTDFDGDVDIDDLNTVRNKFGLDFTSIAWPTVPPPSAGLMAPGGGSSSLLSAATSSTGKSTGPSHGQRIGVDVLAETFRDIYYASRGKLSTDGYSQREIDAFWDLYGWDLLGDADWWNETLGLKA